MIGNSGNKHCIMKFSEAFELQRSSAFLCHLSMLARQDLSLQYVCGWVFFGGKRKTGLLLGIDTGVFVGRAKTNLQLRKELNSFLRYLKIHCQTKKI